MSLLTAVANIIGIAWKSQSRLLLEESGQSRENLIEQLKETEQRITDLGELDRRVNPDDTCQNERRWNHLRKYK